jgi:hypothetical protein
VIALGEDECHVNMLAASPWPRYWCPRPLWSWAPWGGEYGAAPVGANADATTTDRPQPRDEPRASGIVELGDKGAYLQHDLRQETPTVVVFGLTSAPMPAIGGPSDRAAALDASHPSRTALRTAIAELRERLRGLGPWARIRPEFGDAFVDAVSSDAPINPYAQALARFWVLEIDAGTPPGIRAKAIEQLARLSIVESIRVIDPDRDAPMIKAVSDAASLQQGDCDIDADERPVRARLEPGFANHDVQTDGVWRDSPHGVGWSKLVRSVRNGDSSTYKDAAFEAWQNDHIGVMSNQLATDHLSHADLESFRVVQAFAIDRAAQTVNSVRTFPTCISDFQWSVANHALATQSLMMTSRPYDRYGIFPGDVSYASIGELFRDQAGVIRRRRTPQPEAQRLISLAQESGSYESTSRRALAIYVEYGPRIDPAQYDWTCRSESASVCNTPVQVRNAIASSNRNVWSAAPPDLHDDNHAAIQYITYVMNIPVVLPAHNSGVELDSIRSLSGTYRGEFLYRRDDPAARPASGAIYVTASGTYVDVGARTRIRSSLGPALWANTGSVVDFNAWGANVLTAGYYGYLPGENAPGGTTTRFGGSSAATPVVTTLVAYINAMCKYNYGVDPTPMDIKYWLRETGTKQLWSPRNQVRNIGRQPNIYNAAQFAQRDRCYPGYSGVSSASSGTATPQGITKVYLPLTPGDPLYPQTPNATEFPEPDWNTPDPLPVETPTSEGGNDTPPDNSLPPPPSGNNPPPPNCGTCINPEPAKPSWWGGTPPGLAGPWTDVVFNESGGIYLPEVSADQTSVTIRLRLMNSRTRNGCTRIVKPLKIFVEGTLTPLKPEMIQPKVPGAPFYANPCEYSWDWNPNKDMGGGWRGGFDHYSLPIFVTFDINIVRAEGMQSIIVELDGVSRTVWLPVRPSQQGQSMVLLTELHRRVEYWFIFLLGTEDIYAYRTSGTHSAETLPFPPEFLYQLNGQTYVRYGRTVAIYKTVQPKLASAVVALLRCGERLSLTQTEPYCDRLGFVPKALSAQVSNRSGFEHLTGQSADAFSLIALPRHEARTVTQGLGEITYYNRASPPAVTADSYVVFPSGEAFKPVQPYIPLPVLTPDPRGGGEPAIDYPVLIPESKPGCNIPGVVVMSCYNVPTQEEKRLKYERDLATIMALLDEDDDEEIGASAAKSAMSDTAQTQRVDARTGTSKPVLSPSTPIDREPTAGARRDSDVRAWTGAASRPWAKAIAQRGGVSAPIAGSHPLPPYPMPALRASSPSSSNWRRP